MYYRVVYEPNGARFIVVTYRSRHLHPEHMFAHQHCSNVTAVVIF